MKKTVSCEIAKLIDKVSFTNLGWDYIYKKGDDGEMHTERYYHTGPVSGEVYAAPYYTDVIDRLREEFGLCVLVSPYETYSTRAMVAYSWEVIDTTVYGCYDNISDTIFCSYEMGHSTYYNALEEAVLTCCKKIVETNRESLLEMKMHPYILWLDDVRDPKDIQWMRYIEANVGHQGTYMPIKWVKNYREFVHEIRLRSIPKFAFFDHDLGDEIHSGYDCMKHLVDLIMLIGVNPCVCTVFSQSSNPCGKDNILGLYENYKKFFENEKGKDISDISR